MESQELVACVGKAEDAPEVQRMLKAVGVTTKLKMPKDDNEVRLSLTTQGLTLIFEPEGPKTSRLVLSSVMFVSDAEDDYTTYPGALPEGLLFSDTQTEVHAKLGAPDISKPKFRLDMWDRNGLRLAAEYAKPEPQKLAVVSVELPPKR